MNSRSRRGKRWHEKKEVQEKEERKPNLKPNLFYNKGLK